LQRRSVTGIAMRLNYDFDILISVERKSPFSLFHLFGFEAAVMKTGDASMRFMRTVRA
jgi:hypothetical protein